MECSELCALFWAFSQIPTIPPTEDRGLWLRDCDKQKFSLNRKIGLGILTESYECDVKYDIISGKLVRSEVFRISVVRIML